LWKVYVERIARHQSCRCSNDTLFFYYTVSAWEISRWLAAVPQVIIDFIFCSHMTTTRRDCVRREYGIAPYGICCQDFSQSISKNTESHEPISFLRMHFNLFHLNLPVTLRTIGNREDKEMSAYATANIVVK
jgi:hypothetical protein